MATIYWPQHCNIFCCSICWPALFSLIAAVCLHGNISIYLHRMMFQTPQTIYFLKAHHLVMKMTGTNTNTKCFQDPMYAIFIESRGLKDLKYYTGSLLVMTKTRTRFYAVLWAIIICPVAAMNPTTPSVCKRGAVLRMDTQHTKALVQGLGFFKKEPKWDIVERHLIWPIAPS